MSYRFSREEHLKSPKHIAQLFKQGRSVNAFPVRIQWMKMEDTDELRGNCRLKVAFTVPKRKFKRAVDRNRIKRQMIEVFRLNRETLQETIESQDLHIYVMIIYQGDRLPLYSKLEKRLQSGIKKLCEKF